MKLLKNILNMKSWTCHIKVHDFFYLKINEIFENVKSNRSEDGLQGFVDI